MAESTKIQHSIQTGITNEIENYVTRCIKHNYVIETSIIAIMFKALILQENETFTLSDPEFGVFNIDDIYYIIENDLRGLLNTEYEFFITNRHKIGTFPNRSGLQEKWIEIVTSATISATSEQQKLITSLLTKYCEKYRKNELSSGLKNEASYNFKLNSFVESIDKTKNLKNYVIQDSNYLPEIICLSFENKIKVKTFELMMSSDEEYYIGYGNHRDSIYGAESDNTDIRDGFIDINIKLDLSDFIKILNNNITFSKREKDVLKKLKKKYVVNELNITTDELIKIFNAKKTKTKEANDILHNSISKFNNKIKQKFTTNTKFLHSTQKGEYKMEYIPELFENL